MNLSTPKRCKACNTRRTSTELVYFIPTLDVFCLDRDECKNQPFHPARQAEIFPDSEAAKWPLVRANQQEQLRAVLAKYYSEQGQDLLYKLWGKSVSARLEPQQALYIAKVMQKHNFETVNEALRHVINTAIQFDFDQVGKEKLK